MLVDAHNGKLYAFEDTTQYVAKKIVGSIYPVTSDECCPDGCAVFQNPMSHTNTGFATPNNYASLFGIYDWTSGTVTTTLDTRYLSTTDNCGATSESSATGDLDLGGTTGEHDCTVPTGHTAGEGNTFAVRSAAAEMTAINRIARSWVSYPWLDCSGIACLTSNVNVVATCNATYGGNQTNFYRSGGGCRNTGEIAAVFDHEWGHGVDNYDTNGVLSNPSEVIADVVSTIRLHNSCVGRGFWWTYNTGCPTWTCSTNPLSYGRNCGGYGNCCTDCTGIRDSDYAKHAYPVPSTPVGYVCALCGAGGAPCGKEVHCENAPSAETSWDMAARDFQAAPFNMTKQAAFEVTTRIVYIGSGNVANWYTCNCSNNTSGGCTATNGYLQFVNADDDDGNINNGTPHMTGIYAAYNRHGIACSTPTATNSGCAGAPTTAPTLTVTLQSNGAQLNWNAITGAASYSIFKTTGPYGCDFGKIKIASVAGTSYLDTDLSCDIAYYSVQPVGSNSACLGPISNCVTSNPWLPAPSSITATPTAANQITVTWSAVTGATGYNLYRRYTVCSTLRTELLVNNTSALSYVDNTVSGGTSYEYAVSTLSQSVLPCESAKSNWASATGTGTCGLTPCFNGATSAVNNQTSSCGITVNWAAGTSSCPAYPTLSFNIYRSTDPAFVPGSANQLATCRTGTSYVDSTPAYGNTYYYVVRAEDSRIGGPGPCNGGNFDTNVVKVNAAPSGPYTTVFSDGFESGVGNWTISTRWQAAVTYAHTGTYSLISTDPVGLACATCSKTTGIAIPAGSPANFYFWTRHAIESGYDGGIVYGSSNGTTWTKLTPVPAYPATVNGVQACLGASGSPAFSGTNATWTQYTISLAPYAGGNFWPRFTYGTDASISYGGWFIDDVLVNYGSACTSPSAAGKVLNTLAVSKSGTNLSLSWTAPAAPCTPTGYGLYRGTLPWTAYNHSSVSCTISTTTTTTPQDTGSYYYLIVPLNASTEGSYGKSSSGTEIPQGSSPCRTQDLTVCN